jgi:DNA-directed RNA polymerase subunit K/omega
LNHGKGSRFNLTLQLSHSARAKQLNAEKRVLLTLFRIKKREDIDISL